MAIRYNQNSVVDFDKLREMQDKPEGPPSRPPVVEVEKPKPVRQFPYPVGTRLRSSKLADFSGIEVNLIIGNINESGQVRISGEVPPRPAIPARIEHKCPTCGIEFEGGKLIYPGVEAGGWDTFEVTFPINEAIEWLQQAEAK